MLLVCVLAVYLVLALAVDSDELIRQGDQEFISKRYETAIDLYTKAINEDSSNYRAYYKRATVYAQTNRLRQALFDLAQVLNLNSEYYLALQSRAKIQQDLGKWEEALSDLKKVKKLKPDMAAKIDGQITELSTLQSLIEQADNYYKAGSWNEAKSLYSRALDKASSVVSIRLKRASCSYKTGTYNEVIDDTMRILKTDKSNVEAMNIRGNAFRQLGEIETAIAHFKSCIKFSSTNDECKTALKELEQFQSDKSNAKSMAENAATAKKSLELVEKCLNFIAKERLEAFRSEIMLAKCKAHVSLKEADAALSACDNIGGNEAHKLRGQAYLVVEKYEEAVREFQKAVEGGDQGAHGDLQNAQRLLKMSKRKDYYKILDIPKTASLRDIKKAYRSMALKWHPDKNPDQRDLAEQKLQDINEANAVLSDQEKKGRYDRGEDLDDRGGGNPFHGFEGNPFGGFQFHFGRRG